MLAKGGLVEWYT